MRLATAVIALFAISSPLAAQHDMSSMKGMDHDAMHAEKGDGKIPAGWHVRLDDAAAKVTDMKMHKVGNAVHFMTGPATIAWRNTDRAKGNFVVSGDFEQMMLPTHPEAYGLIFAGENLDKDNQSYLYFLVRHDGKFLIKHRAGADTHGIVDWSSSPAIAKPDAKGHSMNRLAVDAGADKIRFMINGRQVAAFDRDKPMGAAGIAGIRVNHNLEMHVNNFKVTRK